MPKTKAINTTIDAFAQQVFGRKRNGKQCVTCGSTKIKPEDFRDDISRKEFGVSYMCQACQDSVFGGEE